MVVHLTAPAGGFVDVYCANGMDIFEYQRVLPARGYYIWGSDHRAGNDTIFISRYDHLSAAAAAGAADARLTARPLRALCARRPPSPSS